MEFDLHVFPNLVVAPISIKSTIGDTYLYCVIGTEGQFVKLSVGDLVAVDFFSVGKREVHLPFPA
ncbi:hypothetical protein [Flavobacterium sp.]|uniref:hypothetical protein n=1 Tax=Flavobacterium sp. TaxID=239 RepID=UPI00120EF969|nr:hypothetical protein [Flavobacterium sp.]RZJ69692.1 MAG: hypothetical protein EOO49_16300 [Flavobacterium sp.]